MRSRTSDTGVVFALNDYAGFLRRLTTDVIDIITVVVAWFLFGLLIAMFILPDEDVGNDDALLTPLLLLLPILTFLYLVILKRSSFRTLGYRFCGVRIVSLAGDTPSIYTLTIRLLFAICGPLNFLLDLIWIPSDPYRQALRDKFAHTYVVRLNAEPKERGRIVYRSYHVLGAAFLFPEVESPSVTSPLTTV